MTNLKEKVRPVFYPNKGKKTQDYHKKVTFL